MGAVVAELNKQIETIERVVAICLYGSPFESRVYESVNVGKIARDRVEFLVVYADSVELLYRGDLPHDSPALVPPRERRYHQRVTSEKDADEAEGAALGRARGGAAVVPSRTAWR